MRIITSIGLALLVGVVLTACSKFEKIRKEGTDQQKYDAAVAYFKAGEWDKAGMLFEELKPILRGSEQQEMATFYEGYCNYHMGFYALSAQQFKQFYETFGRSSYAEEALYMSAYSLYKDSPQYNLDQSNTSTAIDALQSFINGYPDSKFRAEATDILKELRFKLERKAYEKAKLYDKTSPASILNLRSAVVAFANFQRDFPDSEYNEEVAYLRVKSQYEYAENSLPIRQKERFNEAIDFYQAFIDKYPNSKYLRTAERFYENSLAAVDRINKEEQLARQQTPAPAAGSSGSKVGGRNN